MFINRIRLDNYRVYKDSNEIDFLQDEFRNVYIISGNNGYGKTSLLTSLVWCFYGKNIVDVEKKYKEDILDSGGYKRYAKSNLNIQAKSEGFCEYSVSVLLTDIFIPSVPCEKIEIIRSFDTSKDKEQLRILIDGTENELTKEVGNEIFINDFILPREIAKFFFFDAEKIVALAEITSIEEKQTLSRAYSEVLGIKKYEDLKNNLQDLRVRLRRNYNSDTHSVKLDNLYKEIENQNQLLTLHNDKINNLLEELDSKKFYSEQLQERLIREGNALTIEEVQNLKTQIKLLKSEADNLKGQMDDLIDLAPFALSSNLLMNVYQQIRREETNNIHLTDQKKDEIRSKITAKLNKEKVAKGLVEKIISVIEESLSNRGSEQSQINILELEDTEKNLISAVFHKLKYSFSQSFRDLSKAYKDNRSSYAKAVRKLSEAEAKEKDQLIKEIRLEKNKIDERITEIYSEVALVEAENIIINRDVASKQKLISELEKKVKLEGLDIQKDETAARLIVELQVFINKLKSEKKNSLENNIKEELNRLMHKSEFVSKVEVRMDFDMIDIILYRKTGDIIEKEKLSKGEQQLYATALLKALVKESNIKFPVFIDSPLQKFDKVHSDKVINEFYPSISDQVVLFPLLEKELSEKEYKKLNKKVAGAYLINNFQGEYSFFEKVEPNNLFKIYNQEYDSVK